MLKYSRIGVNLLTILVVTSILLTIFFIEQTINSNNVSKIIIPKINLSLEVLEKHDTNETYEKTCKRVSNFDNNVVLEICNINLEQLEKNEIIVYVKNNKTYLYKTDEIKILADISLMKLKEFKDDNLTIIQKNIDRTLTYIQATRLGGVNESSNSK